VRRKELSRVHIYLLLTCFFIHSSSVSSDVNTLTYITGAFRGVESAGQAVAFGIKSSNTTDWLSIGFNIGLFVLSIPFAWFTIRTIGVGEKLFPSAADYAVASANTLKVDDEEVGQIGPITPLEKEKAVV
jgi:hypothetical protein